MILAASIVGSGELIATTTLGAQVGYAALWVYPELPDQAGRSGGAGTLHDGDRRDGLEGFNHVPGPLLESELDRLGWALMMA